MGIFARKKLYIILMLLNLNKFISSKPHINCKNLSFWSLFLPNFSQIIFLSENYENGNKINNIPFRSQFCELFSKKPFFAGNVIDFIRNKTAISSLYFHSKFPNNIIISLIANFDSHLNYDLWPGQQI